jgi:ribonuclease BN (tRNA processing enzyme)
MVALIRRAPMVRLAAIVYRPGARSEAERNSSVKITLVPSAVSWGGGQRGFFLSSYLIDDTVAIDAGGLGFVGNLATQEQIQHVFVTHSHLDHIASLPIFLETVFQSSERCVTLHASPITIDCLQRDIFNDRVWPDFIRLSKQGIPFVKVEALESGVPVHVGDLRVTPIPVDHVVPTLGFLVESAGVAVAIPSDTGPTEEFWSAAQRSGNLNAVFLEASFPNAMSDLAIVSKHLTPAMFVAEARKLAEQVPFIAVHIKPRFYDSVVDELAALRLPDLRVGKPGTTYEFSVQGPVRTRVSR